MSAPYPGRQSPEPERQSGPQLNEPPSSGKIAGSSVRPAPEFSHEKADQRDQPLESNPKHILEDIEAAKYKK
ncbi:uncharacterized protein N7482_002009 [Penicillium canariense]|uniref:Uncharacterized protein n=1 Tax=Penicillium canariense TaxID=189055 RepID=A0A9W9LUQ9_9EURO|nr:uncharacterized protein N7482_002009 [Penicillium canariense]KAJ5176132.1 hypothetical protein N7482_002009 [Penicillium canariense]